MKFGQWGDRPAKEDGSFSFGPVNVVNSTAHTSAISPHQRGGTQLPRRGEVGVRRGGLVVVRELYRAGWRVKRKGGRGGSCTRGRKKDER